MTGNTGPLRETVEAGWQVYEDFYGDLLAHIFIFYTGDNYGANSCYNLECNAFVQVNSSVAPGGVVPAWAQSVYGGFQQEQPFGYQRNAAGDWWWAYAGQWIGYYPRSKFDSTGLLNGASKVSFGGEVAYADDLGRAATTWMGSGNRPYATGEASYTYAAYQRNLTYIQGVSSPLSYHVSGAISAATPACYSALTGFQSGARQPVHLFRWGWLQPWKRVQLSRVRPP